MSKRQTVWKVCAVEPDGSLVSAVVGLPIFADTECWKRTYRGSNGENRRVDECYAFSDSYSDLPMLSVVGHPAAVNPDRRLSLLAKAYSWPSFELTQAP